jgi:hypothetical protein
MGRYLAGVASAVLLITGGLFLWTGLANRAPSPLPAAPTAVGRMLAAVTPAATQSADVPPQATEQTREQKRFDRYDRNRDGHVDREEYLLARHKAFAKLDLNGDGKLSFDEYAVKTETKFAKADADRSGTLDAAEFATTAIVRKPKPRCQPVMVKASPPAEEGDEG